MCCLRAVFVLFRSSCVLFVFFCVLFRSFCVLLVFFLRSLRPLPSAFFVLILDRCGGMIWSGERYSFECLDYSTIFHKFKTFGIFGRIFKILLVGVNK